jgi:hypothetical protein
VIVHFLLTYGRSESTAGATVLLNDFQILSTVEEGSQIMYIILKAVVLMM